MDNQLNESSKNRTDNLYTLSGFTYGPSDPNSLEETRIGGIKINVKGPENPTLISDSFGNFSSGLLPEGKYKLSFFDRSQKYFATSTPANLGRDLNLPVFLHVIGDKRKGERKDAHGAGFLKNVIHGFTLSRKRMPVSGITVAVKSVVLEKKKQRTLGKVLNIVTKIALAAFKRKGAISGPKQEEQSISLELKTNRIGRFSTKKLPNGSYIVSCSDPSGKNRFSSKFVVLKGKPVAPLFFTGYTEEDLEELKKRDLERKEKEAEEKAKKEKEGQEQKTEQDKSQQQTQKRQERTRQKLEEQLRKAQAQRTAAQTRATELSRASREGLMQARMPFRTVGEKAYFFGQRGAGFAGKAATGSARAGIKGAESGLRAGLTGARLVFTGLRIIPLIGATPVGWIAAGIGIVILLIVLIVFFGGGSPSIPFLSSGGSGGTGGPGGPGSKTATGLNYYIPIRDSGVVPEDIKNIILASWPNAQIDNWDIIVSESINNGWNPAFLLALWIEESGAQGVPSADPLGCAPDPNNPTTDINVSLGCVFKSFKDYTNDRFADFMCRYGGDNFGDAPCSFNIHNPNFPKNVRSWYEKLVPAGSYGALIEVPPPQQGPLSATCPIAGGTAATVTCGSFFTLRSNCGHCRSDAGYANYLGMCTYDAINYAEDIGGAAGQDVILPSINGAVIDWTLVHLAPSSIGAIRYFSGVNKQTNEEYWIQFHHVDASYGTTAGKSGDVGARICTSSSECNHVHVEFSTVTQGGGKTPQDAPLFLCI